MHALLLPLCLLLLSLPAWACLTLASSDIRIFSTGSRTDANRIAVDYVRKGSSLNGPSGSRRPRRPDGHGLRHPHRAEVPSGRLSRTCLSLPEAAGRYSPCGVRE